MRTIYFETYEDGNKIESFAYHFNTDEELKVLRQQMGVMARTKLEAHKNWDIKVFVK